MKKVALAAAGALCLSTSLGGCVVDDAINTLSSPAATTAAANLSKLTNALECFVAVGSGAALAGEKAGGSDGQTVTNIIYTSTADLCTQKGGTTGAAVSVPSTSVVSQ